MTDRAVDTLDAPKCSRKVVGKRDTGLSRDAIFCAAHEGGRFDSMESVTCTYATKATFDAEHIQAIRTAMQGGGYVPLAVGEKLLAEIERLQTQVKDIRELCEEVDFDNPAERGGYSTMASKVLEILNA